MREKGGLIISRVCESRPPRGSSLSLLTALGRIELTSCEVIMFNWLRGKKSVASSVSPIGPLAFKSNDAAFAYACQQMQSDLAEGLFLPAIVLDASKEFGTQKAVATDAKGVQTALLLVCSRDGGFRVMAQTASKDGPTITVGDLVAWQAMAFRQEFANLGSDERFGWMGLILGTLKPEWHNDVGWVGADRFR